ncbi:hypothetical protein [Victivallis sp. Marseille-Q1083]|uniref:hypothetical protein n=1 Tax=Victivallis sp. Marseille-Q1083 TaxID=2717288 RepID=UPI00158AFED6|nr:hypothetical protein [Victivallis sp. Marseille-Q1083]
MGGYNRWSGILLLAGVAMLSGCVSQPAPELVEPVRFRAVPAEASSGRFLSESNFIGKWQVMLPVTVAAASDLTVTGTKNAVHRFELPADGAPVIASAGKDGGVDLADRLAAADAALTALTGELVVPGARPMDALLYVGSSGALKIYLNGRLVYVYDQLPRRAVRDQERVEVRLQPGVNVLKLISMSGRGEWKVYCRPAGADEMPWKFAEENTRAGEISKK